MKTSIDINYKPRKSIFPIIEEWTRVEFENTGFGCYENIQSIRKCLEIGKMVTITLNKYPIGFITWYSHASHSARIQNVEIHPEYRYLGYGKFLVKHFISYLKDIGYFTVDLEFISHESQLFWKSLDFIKYNDKVYHRNSNKELYKIIVDNFRSNSFKETKSEVIELWYNEPDKTINIQPDRQWYVKFKKNSRELVKPIIIACKYEWRIRWRKGDEIFYDEKIRRFEKIKHQYGLSEYKEFLIIERL